MLVTAAQPPPALATLGECVALMGSNRLPGPLIRELATDHVPAASRSGLLCHGSVAAWPPPLPRCMA